MAQRRDRGLPAPGVEPAQYFSAETFSGYEPVACTNDQFVATVASGGALGVLRLADQLLQDPSVAWASPNFRTQGVKYVNDPLYSNQWHLNNTGQSGGTADADVDAPEAWGTASGNSNVVVAVLDDGVQTSHPDLNMWQNPGEVAGNGLDDDGNGYVDDLYGWNFLADTNNPSPADPEDSHGTCVAGVIAAQGNNSLGGTGVAYGCRVMGLKMATGFTYATDAQLASAIYYAGGRTRSGAGTWRGADVLNFSWGWGTSSTVTSALSWTHTNGRGGMGVPIFVSSGNGASGYSDYSINFGSGNWVVEWRYQKNVNGSEGSDTAWLGMARFPNGNLETFTSSSMPSGWSTSGNANWSAVSDATHAYAGIGTDNYAMKAGAIGNNQDTRLRTPSFTGGGTLQYRLWVSSQEDHDGVHCYYSSNGGGTFTEITSFFASGVPSVTTAVGYPASLSSSGITIAVGASNDFDYRSPYSQYGSNLDFVAPSSGGIGRITTTDRTGTDGYNDESGTVGDYCADFGGTSSASPLAAGIGALLLSRNPNLTAEQVRQTMRSTADKIGGVTYSGGFNSYFGYGRLNASAALLAIDTTAPTAAITPNGTTVNTSPITFTITFSEPVTGVDLADLAAAGSQTGALTLANFTPVSATVYTVDVGGMVSGEQVTLTLTAAGSGIQDAAGNLLAADSAATVAFDNIAPAAAITPNGTTTNTSPITFTITFSEPVTGVDLADLAAAGSQTGALTLANFTPVSATVYTVDVGGMVSGEQVTLTLTAAGSGIQDAAGNLLAADSAATVAFDNIAPAAAITPNGTTTNTSPITFTITFSEPVTGVDLADLAAAGSQTGALTLANFTPVSATVYTVDVGGMVSGEQVTLTLTAAGSEIQDAAGNLLAANAVATVGFDNTAPAAPIVAVPAGPVTVNAATYSIQGSAEADSLVRVYVDANNDGIGESVAGSQQLTGGGMTYAVLVDLAQDAANDFVVTATDAAANESPAADVPTITEDSTTPSWTFMVYLDGDNNLEQAALDDFLEMASAGSDAEINIVAQFDRIDGYSTGYDNWTGTRRGLIDSGDLPSAAWGADLGEQNMGDPATLTEFVGWTIANYPAQRYALVLWDHGDGWRGGGGASNAKGACSDDTSADYLENREVGQALADIPQQLDLVGYDACLMGMLETMHEVADEASVFVGSEQLEPGDGWPYDTILSDLKGHPSWTAAQLGADIAVRYGESYGGGETQAAIDLAKVADAYPAGVSAAVSHLADAIMAESDAADYARLQTHRAAAVSFDDADFRDLGTFLGNVAADTEITAAIRAAAVTALDAYAGAVLQNHSGPDLGGTGISIYFQQAGRSPDPDYGPATIQFAADTHWDEFLAWWRSGPPIQLGESTAKFNDLNGNGARDAGEPGLPNWTIFLDGNQNGQVNVNAVSNPATGTINLAIPDESTVFSSLEVSGIGAPVVNVNVTLTIEHTYDSDLAVYLISPAGTSVELFANVGDNGDGFTNTTLDDEATTAIGSGVAPFTGTYRPSGSLSAFDGQWPDGTWQLEITDGASGDDGTLVRWSLTLITSEASTQTSGEIDHDGEYAFTGLSPGTYTVAEVGQAGWQQTAPAGGTHLVTLVAGEIVTGKDFGNRVLASAVPGQPDLQPLFDTGSSSDDNVTNLDNSDLARSLQFVVPDTIAGATVALYANGMPIGWAEAGGTTTVVTTNGGFDLLDGTWAITATQTEPGNEPSAPSLPLTIVVNTIAPVAGAPDLDAASDSGVSDGDDVTQGIDPHFQGSAVDPSPLTQPVGINGSCTTVPVLTITGGATLNLTVVDLVVTADDFTKIAGYVASGYNGGAWNGPGIVSLRRRQ